MLTLKLTKSELIKKTVLFIDENREFKIQPSVPVKSNIFSFILVKPRQRTTRKCVIKFCGDTQVNLSILSSCRDSPVTKFRFVKNLYYEISSPSLFIYDILFGSWIS